MIYFVSLLFLAVSGIRSKLDDSPTPMDIINDMTQQVQTFNSVRKPKLDDQLSRLRMKLAEIRKRAAMVRMFILV